MKSRPLGVQSILATDHNTRRDDARGGSFLLVHQQQGALALPTNPTNGQTLTLTINGTAIVLTYVSAIGSAANNILIQGTAALTAIAITNFLRRPDITNANQVAASVPNQALIMYLGYSLSSGGTTITPFSFNKNVNGATSNFSSLTVSTTVTGASWTAQTMQLYVEDGAYYIGTTRVLFTGGSTSTFTAPVSNPRIDLITADSSGTIALVTGTEAASPTAPSYPANKAVLAEVYHVVGETALYDFENQQAGQGYISNDVRPTLLIPYISSLTQVATGLFVPDPGGDAQGDVLYYNGSIFARLPAGVSGQVLQTLGAGANPTWASPAATLTRNNTQVDLASSTTETTMWDYTLAANLIGANNGIWMRMWFSSLASATTVTYRLYFGGSVVSSFTSPTAVSIGRPGYVDVIIMNLGSTSSQRFHWTTFCSPNGVFSSSNGWSQIQTGTSAVNTTSTQHITLTVQYSATFTFHTTFDEGIALLM